MMRRWSNVVAVSPVETVFFIAFLAVGWLTDKFGISWMISIDQP